MIKKLAILGLSASCLFSAALYASECFVFGYDIILEDVPMQCPSCGKTHRPKAPCS